MLKSLVQKNRSYRRFHESIKINRTVLLGLVELARLSASSGNLQPLKFFLSNTKKTNHKIFPFLKWAGYLKGWEGPGEGERPSAYIVLLGDTRISKLFAHDAGIAAQSILLGAVEKRLGGCIIGSIQREKMRKALHISRHLEILLVLALGKPKEKVVIEPMAKNGTIRYWRDHNGVHHVPKRSLDEIALFA